MAQGGVGEGVRASARFALALTLVLSAVAVTWALGVTPAHAADPVIAAAGDIACTNSHSDCPADPWGHQMQTSDLLRRSRAVLGRALPGSLRRRISARRGRLLRCGAVCGRSSSACLADAAEVSGNAYYRPSEDVVAWDAEGLLPELREKFGDFMIPVVMAHEWGHAYRRGRTSPTRTADRQCGTAGRLLRGCLGHAMRRTTGVFEVTAPTWTTRSQASSKFATRRET